MKKLEVKLADDDMAKLDDLVRERQTHHVGGVTTRADIIRLLIRAEWLIQQTSPKPSSYPFPGPT
jgi:hypothetical protein